MEHALAVPDKKFLPREVEGGCSSSAGDIEGHAEVEAAAAALSGSPVSSIASKNDEAGNDGTEEEVSEKGDSPQMAPSTKASLLAVNNVNNVNTAPSASASASSCSLRPPANAPAVKNKKAVLLVDGYYWWINCRAMNMNFFKMKALLMELLGVDTLECIYFTSCPKEYYATVLQKLPDARCHEEEAYQRQLRHNFVRVKLFTFKLQHVRDPQTRARHSGFVQKGVDQAIAAELVDKAKGPEYSQVALLTGDGDFEYAVEKVVDKFNKPLWLVNFGDASDDLMMYTEDGRRNVDLTKYYRRLQNQAQDDHTNDSDRDSDSNGDVESDSDGDEDLQHGVVVMGLPPGGCVVDLRTPFASFGNIVRVDFPPGRDHAFVIFDSGKAAARAVEHFRQCPLCLQGRRVKVALRNGRPNTAKPHLTPPQELPVIQGRLRRGDAGALRSLK